MSMWYRRAKLKAALTLNPISIQHRNTEATYFTVLDSTSLQPSGFLLLAKREKREMNAVCLVRWQSSRLGVPASCIGRVGFALLRKTITSSNQSQHYSRSLHGILDCSPVPLHQTCKSRPKTALYEHFSYVNRQARCASLRKKNVEESSRQKAARSKPFMSRAELNPTFGPMVDRKEANDLLERLQEHRHRGTLDQTLPYSNALIDKGLRYLRAKYPFDEDAAIIARIDRELGGKVRLPQTNIDQSPQAVSQFEKLRRENIQRRKEENSEEEKEDQSILPEKGSKADRRVTIRDASALGQPRPELEWIQKYRDKAQMKELPEMSAWARLLPSGLLTVAVVTLAVFFAQHYTQPPREARLWPDLPPAAATVITLIGVNFGVFVLWRLPPFWRLLNRNFLVVPAYPYSMSMLTACFSHQEFTHLLSNIIPLWFIGTHRRSRQKFLPSICWI